MSEESPHLDRGIDELELSARTASCLHNAGILYIRDLVQKTAADLLELKRFTPQCLEELQEILAEMDLTLARE